MKKILFFCSLLAACTVNAQQLSAEEQKIIAYIRQNLPQNLKLLEEIVNINSGSMNVEGVKKVGEVLGKHLNRSA
jgi:glutamate carboxypeptidase